jgi:tetratricopeptide (TPR) repeat protein
MAGPKTVVFFSEGFLSLGEESEVQHASGAANRAGAHFYTVDARGLNKGSGASIIDEPASFDAAGPSTRFDMQEDGTNALAVDTGGMAIRNENNFGRALDMIQRDAATYYVLGYTPSNQAFDGKYRTISVTVKRPGVKVRARRGYLALEPAKLIKPTPITAPADVRRPSAATEQPSSGVEAPAAAAAESAAVPASAATPAAAPAAGAPLPGATGTSADPAAADPTAEATKASASALRKRIESNGLVEELQGPTARLAPGKSDDLAGKGWAAYQKGDVENAARYLGQASKSPDVHPWVNYALGLSHLALQQYPDAVRAWEDVRRAEPDFEPVYFNLADGYMLQRDEPAALRVLHDAEQRWPKDPELWNAIGVLQVRRGDYDAAIESFRKATTVAPEDSLGVFNLAKAYQLRALKFQRFDSARERWVGGEGDLKKASEYYARYVQLGGPFVQQAKEALQMLTWK